MSDELTILNETLRLLMDVYIFPYFITFILDILVVFRLSRSKTNIFSSISTRTRKTGNSRASRFTINTILIDFFYLIIYFPFAICSLFIILNLYNSSVILVLLVSLIVCLRKSFYH